MRAEVNVAGDASQCVDPDPVAQIEERLQVAWVPLQPVDMPDDDTANAPGAQVIQQPLVLRPLPAAPGADVVVDVTISDDPAAPGREPFAVLQLAHDPELVAIPVRRNPGVDTHPNQRRRGHTLHSGNISEHWPAPAPFTPDAITVCAPARPDLQGRSQEVATLAPCGRRTLLAQP